MQEYYFKEINSTQDYAKEISQEGQKEFVVLADVQFKGRGRLCRTWEAPFGGLWFSFDSDFYNKDGIFTITMGVAVREVLSEVYNCKVQLKWPNDLIVDNKKVGGIICEKINEKIIVGIGINTNVKDINEKKAITFLNKTQKSVDNYKLMREIIKRCKECLSMRSEEIIRKFRGNMAYVGEYCFVSALNKIVKIIDIANDGKLIVDTDEGIKEVFTGEINECI